MRHFKQLVQLKVVVCAMFLLGVASTEARSFQDENESGSNGRFVITASATSICGADEVTLTADVTGGTVTWLRNNRRYGTGNPITVSGAEAAGKWIAIHNTGGCENRMSNSLLLSLAAVPSSPISGNNIVCANTPQTYSVTYAPDVTYTWSVPTGNGWVITAGQGTNSITVTAGTASGTITVTPSNSCGDGTASSLSVIVHAPIVLPLAIAGNTSVCAGTTGLTYSVTPESGVGYSWVVAGTGWAIASANTGSQITVTAGTSNGTITVTPNNACGNGTPGAVNVALLGTQSATIVGEQSFCLNTAITPFTHTTTGATNINVSNTGLPTGLTASFASNTITISGTPTITGTFKYNIPLTGGCGTDTAKGSITVTAAKTAGAASSTPTLCINTALTAITHSTTGATGISNNGVFGANGLPAGVSASWASNTITISGTPTASGTFNYKIPLTGGCGTDTAKGTITVAPKMTAGAASITTTLCINTALMTITHSTTGATGISNNGVLGANGLPAGVSASWASNTITISGTPTASGAFTYKIPLTGGCGTDTAKGTITVSSFTQNDPSNTMTCSGSFNFGMTAATGPGILTYRWEQSPDSSSWTTVSSATTANPTLTVTGNTYFRRIVTSSTCGYSITSNAALVTISRPARPVFMSYNLGADSTITDPKEQMRYLSKQTDPLDGHVMGGWYQWGRKPVAYAINPTTYMKYSGNGAADHAANWASIMTGYDGNGQIVGQDDYHVYNNSSALHYDWSVPQNDTLWGNGELISTPTPGAGAVFYNGNYYQKPNKTINDPCPTGWRVPTQDEWERMSNYDCNPSVAGGNFDISSPITKPANNSLTWVFVRCANNDCTADNSWWGQNAPPFGGYAIYETSVWDAAPVAAGGSLISAGAPQPLLFLPFAGGRYEYYGGVIYIGTTGYYWSSTLRKATTVTGNVPFVTSMGISGVMANNAFPQAHGMSIRCVKE